MSDEILVDRDGKAGRIRLNRPKALNALTTAMCERINEALEDWRGDDSIEIVLIDHAEGRGFCAGGDVKAVAASGASDGAIARDFFFREYRMNHRLVGAECLKLGMATHYIPADRLEELKGQLAAMPGQAPALLETQMTDPGAGAIFEHAADIDRLFASDRYEDILAALAADPSEFAAKTLVALKGKSPQACKVSLRLLAESLHLGTFAQEMALEFGIAARVSMRHDFIEGVRALLIDKDNAPRWNPATPEDVTDNLLDTIFAPLPDSQAWTPHD